MEALFEILTLLLALLIVILIHELGHVFAVKMVGGKLVKLTLGRGKEIFSLGVLQVNMIFFAGGSYNYSTENQLSKGKQVLIHISGPIANLLSGLIAAVIAALLIDLNILQQIFFGSFVGFMNLLPFGLFNRNSDGMQLYQSLRYGKSEYFRCATERSVTGRVN